MNLGGLRGVQEDHTHQKGFSVEVWPNGVFLDIGIQFDICFHSFLITHKSLKWGSELSPCLASRMQVHIVSCRNLLSTPTHSAPLELQDDKLKGLRKSKKLKLERDDDDTTLFLVAEKGELQDLVDQEMKTYLILHLLENASLLKGHTTLARRHLGFIWGRVEFGESDKGVRTTGWNWWVLPPTRSHSSSASLLIGHLFVIAIE